MTRKRRCLLISLVVLGAIASWRICTGWGRARPVSNVGERAEKYMRPSIGAAVEAALWKRRTLEHSGSGVTGDIRGLGEIEDLHVYVEGAVAADLTYLRRCSSLVRLTISGHRVGGGSILKYLPNPERMKYLNCEVTGIDNTGLDIGSMPALIELTVCGVGQDEIREALRNKPNLKVVTLMECQLADAGMAGAIMQCERLEAILVSHCEGVDAFIGRAEGCARIKRLAIRWSEVSDKALEGLLEWRMLREVRLPALTIANRREVLERLRMHGITVGRY